jgi:transcriptional regulator with XRE-family HTH domain
MAQSPPSRSGLKGGKAKRPKSRINTNSKKRGKYRPRKAPLKLETPGQRIRAARVALGLTQREVGGLLRTDQTTISAWEKDKTNLAGPSLVALAELLQTTPEALLTGVGFHVPQEPVLAQKRGVRVGHEKRTIPLPPEPLEGHLAWVEKTDPSQPRILENAEALKEIKRAIALKRKLWIVVE